MESTEGKDPNSNSNELKLGGNILLSGFSLEPIEMIVVKKIVGHYAKKIGEKTSYKEIRVRLRQAQKNQSFLHGININVPLDKGTLTCEVEDKNLYSGLSSALEKIYSQAEHKLKC